MGLGAVERMPGGRGKVETNLKEKHRLVREMKVPQRRSLGIYLSCPLLTSKTRARKGRCLRKSVTQSISKMGDSFWKRAGMKESKITRKEEKEAKENDRYSGSKMS